MMRRVSSPVLRGEGYGDVSFLPGKSWAAKCLAVRRVTQDNKGKQTAGVDGKKSLTPKQRLDLVKALNPRDGIQKAKSPNAIGFIQQGVQGSQTVELI